MYIGGGGGVQALDWGGRFNIYYDTPRGFVCLISHSARLYSLKHRIGLLYLLKPHSNCSKKNIISTVFSVFHIGYKLLYLK